METQNEELLIKALCGYLPYGVTLHNLLKDYDARLAEVNWLRNSVGVTGTEKGSRSIMTDSPLGFYKGAKYVQQWLPYLRPMSSMTEKEFSEIKKLFGFEITTSLGKTYINDWKQGLNEINYNIDLIDWLNSHHLDYRGLIPMGLALPTPEGMYGN